MLIKLIKWIDQRFKWLIPDPVGRVALLHLPFWGLVIFSSHVRIREYGLLTIWLYVFLVAWPVVAAKVLVLTAEEENKKALYDPSSGLKVVIFSYLVYVLTMIGIPGAYPGLIPFLLQTDTFSTGYQYVMVYWYRAFSFGDPVNKKVLVKFISSMLSQRDVWHRDLFFSHVVTAPILAAWFYSKSKARAYALQGLEEKREAEQELQLKLEAERFEEEKRRQLEQAKKNLEEKKLKEERFRQQKALEEEKQKKLAAKINEVKGKSPWDSGFL